MKKRLVIDKSAAEIDKFLESARIIYNSDKGIYRDSFCLEMKNYMESEEAERIEEGKEESTANDTSRNRKYFNKAKWLLYYGFAKKIKDENNKEMLIITERGKKLVEKCINHKNYKTSINKGTEEIFVDLIMESILYDSFGIFNDGVDTSCSDIEPPKVILKAINDLGYLTSIECIYMIFSLDIERKSNYEDKVRQIKLWREENNVKNIKNEVDKLGVTNFVSDNKLLQFLERTGLLSVDSDRKYTIVPKYYKKYKSEIIKMQYKYQPMQKIYFGPPGTGKSYNIENVILGGVNVNDNLFRINFHPDYTYSDFIGHLIPKKTERGLDYEFKAGAFTIALEKALLNPKEKFYMVIEEINRGNTASIFGDIFQLLDRVKERNSKLAGWSKYGINNSEIYEYLCKNVKLKGVLKNYVKENIMSYNTIKIPHNLNILATMNTADQNVFIIDSAFKRRFQMQYIPIKFEKNNSLEHKTYDVFYGDRELTDIFADNKFILKLINDESIERTWSGFAKIVNFIIDKVNIESYEISEDKKLGPYFIKEEDLRDRDSFTSKVVYYLKHDVFKYNEIYFNQPFEVIYTDIVLNNKDIFELLKPQRIN